MTTFKVFARPFETKTVFKKETIDLVNNENKNFMLCENVHWSVRSTQCRELLRFKLKMESSISFSPLTET